MVKSRVIQFRVTEELFKKLHTLATRVEMKPSEFARTILTEYLDGRLGSGARDGLEELKEEVLSLRDLLQDVLDQLEIEEETE